jgi:hypothetical protein
VDERERRVGINEALFREVNERIGDLQKTNLAGNGQMLIVCECGRAECTERLSVSTEEYAQTREDSRTFLVLPGHVIPDVERVVRDGPGYEIVEKDPGGPAQLAEETDPRN